MAHDTKTGLPIDRNANPIQVLAVEDTVNVTATGTAVGATALPSGTQVAMLSADQPVWIKFGGASVSITAAEAGAILLPGGGVTIRLESGDTHFNAIRAGTTNAITSVAKLV